MNSMNRTATPMLTAPGREVDDLVVVHPALEHDVDLDRIETRLLRRGDAVEHSLELVALA